MLPSGGVKVGRYVDNDDNNYCNDNNHTIIILLLLLYIHTYSTYT